MADAFASQAVESNGGLDVQEWLNRNYPSSSSSSSSHLVGEELIDVFSITGNNDDYPSQLPRKRCALLLTNPQKWRANSQLSWYYEPILTGTVLSPSGHIQKSTDGTVSSGTAVSSFSSLTDTHNVPIMDENDIIMNHPYYGYLKVVEYEEAIKYSAKVMEYNENIAKQQTAEMVPSVLVDPQQPTSTATRSTPVSNPPTPLLPPLVVPLFRQINRAPRGSRFAIPLQFAADCVSAGIGGVNWKDDHIAVAYFNVLQTLAHHASHAPEHAIHQWLTIFSYLLEDFDVYCQLIPEVHELVEHLRFSETAPDMLQYAFSFILSKRTFTREERLRLLETSLKRTYKMHEDIMSKDGIGRIIATTILVPLLYGLHYRIMPLPAVGAHYCRVRKEIFDSAQKWGDEARAMDAKLAADREAKHRAAAKSVNERLANTDISTARRSAVSCTGSYGAGGTFDANGLFMVNKEIALAQVKADAEATDKLISMITGGNGGNKPLDFGPRTSFIEQKEAELLALVMKASGLIAPKDIWSRFISFCKDRELIENNGTNDIDNDDDDDEDGKTNVTSKTKKTAKNSNDPSPFIKKHSKQELEGKWREKLVEQSKADRLAEEATRKMLENEILLRQGSSFTQQYAKQFTGTMTTGGGEDTNSVPSPNTSVGTPTNNPYRPRSRSNSIVSIDSHASFRSNSSAFTNTTRSRYDYSLADRSTNWRDSNSPLLNANNNGNSSFTDDDNQSVHSRFSSFSSRSPVPTNRYRTNSNTFSVRNGPGASESTPNTNNVSTVPPPFSPVGARPPRIPPSTSTSGTKTGGVTITVVDPNSSSSTIPGNGSVLASSSSSVTTTPTQSSSKVGTLQSGATGKYIHPALRKKMEEEAAKAGTTAVTTIIPVPPKKAWKLKNLGVRADLEVIGLIKANVLPFVLSTGGIFKGVLTINANDVKPVKLEEDKRSSEETPTNDTLAQETVQEKSKTSNNDSTNDDKDAMEIDEYPYMETSPSSVGVRIIPEYRTIFASPVPDETMSDYTVMNVLVTLRAPALPSSSTTRASLSLLSIVDTSGSMSGSNIKFVKESLNFIVPELNPTDEFSLTKFTETGTNIVPVTLLDNQGIGTARAGIASLEADGGTNISSGLTTAFENYEACFKVKQAKLSRTGANTIMARAEASRVVSILLLSDGQDSNSHHLEAFDPLIEKAKTLDVAINTFGFGADHDANLLHHLANRTGGAFTYIERPEQINDAFAAMVGGLSSCITRDMRLTIRVPTGTSSSSSSSSTYPNGITLHKVYTAYENTVNTDNTEVNIHFGNMYADEKRDILVALRIPNHYGKVNGEEILSLVQAQATFTHLQEQKTVDSLVAELKIPVLPMNNTSLSQSNDESSSNASEIVTIRKSHIEVDIARNRDITATLLKEVLNKCDQGLFEEANKILSNGVQQLIDSVSSEHTSTIALIDDLETLRSKTSTDSALNRGGRATLLGALSSHANQRFTAGTSDGLSSANAYQVQSQARMLLTARMSRGADIGNGTNSALRTVGLRHRSNFDRAMTAEAKLEPVSVMVKGKSTKGVRAVGTITTAWSAVAFAEDGKYILRVKRLGVRKMARPEFILYANDDDNDDDAENTTIYDDNIDGNDHFSVVSKATSKSFAATLDATDQASNSSSSSTIVASATSTLSSVQDMVQSTSISATGESLAPGIRITYGNVLFGGAIGTLFSYGETSTTVPVGSVDSSFTPSSTADSNIAATAGTDSNVVPKVLVNDTSLAWNMDDPLVIELVENKIIITLPSSPSSSANPNKEPLVIEMARLPTLPMILGLHNVIATITKEET